MDADVIEAYRNAEKNELIEIIHDPDPHSIEDPLENDKDWCRFLTGKSQRYKIGTERLEHEQIDEEVKEAEAAGHIVAPVHMYDHSAVAFSLGDFGDPWDSGQCGVVIIDPAAYEKHVGLKPDKALETFGAMLKDYTNWVNGWALGFRRYKLSICDHGEEHREEIDAVHSFLGIDPKEAGVLDEANLTGKNGKLAEGWEEVRG